MRRFMVVLSVMVVAGFAAIAFAEPEQGCNGCGSKSGQMFGRMFDGAKTETFSGQVVSVESVASRRERQHGIVIKLNTGDPNMIVHLGPEWFLEQQALKISAGDTVEITGKRVVRRGENIFLASVVKKGSGVLKLRNEEGVPVWAASKRGACGQGV